MVDGGDSMLSGDGVSGNMADGGDGVRWNMVDGGNEVHTMDELNQNILNGGGKVHGGDGVGMLDGQGKVHVGDGVCGNVVDDGYKMPLGDEMSEKMINIGDKVNVGDEMSEKMINGGDKVNVGDGLNGNLMDGGNEVHDGDLVSGNMEVHDGDGVSGNMVDDRNEVHAGDGQSGKLVDCGDGGNAHPPSLDSVEIEGDTNFKPYPGMEFESNEEAYTFYQEYAKCMGFSATKRNSRRSKKLGILVDANFACSRYGSSRGSGRAANRRPCVKIGCKAGMNVKRREDGKWVIHSFIKEHNHEFLPALAYYFRSDGDKDLVGKNDTDANAQTRKMDVATSRQSAACQNVGWLKNIRNQFDNARNFVLDSGDAQVMLKYFMRMQNENSNFFYAIDLNEEQCLRNVFWVDAKSRHDYMNFGDVVCFDTTYIRNKCKMPFVPFIGVNHHFQFVLLGCTLIADETKSTFVWLMKTWLRAMGGRAPKVIITDQDKTMEETIAEVFPDVRHCYSLWHILGKIPENLGHITKRHESFMSKFNKCIYRSWKVEQFEKRWWKIVERFELKDDEWIQSLYKDRKKWVPTYMNDTFLAGMSSTERSESLISFFDKYVHEKITLKEFIEQYETILHDRYEEEAKADFGTWHEQPALKSLSSFEKQLSTVYTHAIFKKFQVEILGVIACHPKLERNDDTTITYRVQDFEDHQDFLVAWNETKLEVLCLCRSFEYKGFLCRHAMIVLQMSGVSNIPSHYILKRWTRDAKSRHNMRRGSEQVQSRVQRYNDLCEEAMKLGEEGSLSEVSYNIALRSLEEALQQCVTANNSIKSVAEPNTSATHGHHDMEEESQGKSTTKASKKKNTIKRRKVHSEPEAITLRTQDSSQQMGHLTSRVRILDGSFVTQQSMHGMEQISSRALTLDGYYGTRQGVQGVVQLNLMGSTRDGYFGNQQGMQGLGPLNSTAPDHGDYYGTQQSMQGLGRMDFRSPTNNGGYGVQGSLEDLNSKDKVVPNRKNNQKNRSEKEDLPQPVSTKNWVTKNFQQDNSSDQISSKPLPEDDVDQSREDVQPRIASIEAKNISNPNDLETSLAPIRVDELDERIPIVDESNEDLSKDEFNVDISDKQESPYFMWEEGSPKSDKPVTIRPNYNWIVAKFATDHFH
ncbi:hypothetical protein HHK36_003831 [Tetracentron sinense]|uniref:SWIM-type domain-containing protein n=1 Tax=Tetracentron sinense TaxID=13715 RepID=A0A834ZNZ5_TETSI|nr:hypothetical protein HHK36_003831 [Tetracentron sinense]